MQGDYEEKEAHQDPYKSDYVFYHQSCVQMIALQTSLETRPAKEIINVLHILERVKETYCKINHESIMNFIFRDSKIYF